MNRVIEDITKLCRDSLKEQKLVKLTTLEGAETSPFLMSLRPA